jgi:hypothetical protein
MLRPALVALVCPLVLSLTAPASAQPSPDTGTVLVGAAAFAAIEKLPTSSGFGIDDDASGTVAGGSIGLGLHLTPRISARVEWGLTDTLRSSRSLGVNPLAGSASLTFIGPVVTTGPELSIVSPSIERKRQTAVGALLVGYHVPAGRASIEVLGGIGFVNQDLQEAYDVRILRGLSLPFPRSEYRASTYHAVAVAGADIAVSLTDHAALVPTIRAFALNGGLSLRPGLGLRWTF